MIIAIDFDGTVVEHKFPLIGEDVPYVVETLQGFVADGHKLILFTMRSGEYLDAAVQWFKDRDIELWGIQFNPQQYTWTTSNKAYAQLYIDDAAIGCPLCLPEGFERPCVDWIAVSKIIGEV